MHKSPVERLEGRALLASVSFAIDPAASYLTIKAVGDVDHVGDVKLKAQDDGLDTARLQGTVVADVTSKGVRFNGGSAIDAVAHEGEFDPGNDDADFAVKGKIKKLITLAELDAAIRDIKFDVESTGRKKLGSGRKFDLRNASLEITAGTIDYKLDSKFGDADGSRDLAGLKDKNASTYGKVTGATGQRYLTMPIRIDYERDFSNGTAEFSLTGIIVAKETTSASAQAVGLMPAAVTTKKRVSANDAVSLI
jgi:hypothetical protein